jgi:hypothetical protein
VTACRLEDCARAVRPVNVAHSRRIAAHAAVRRAAFTRGLRRPFFCVNFLRDWRTPRRFEDFAMQDTLVTPVIGQETASKLETGLGAWASAISGDDNAQAAIALAEAINRARNSQATRENRAADARVIAVSRLETLRARLAPVYAAIPRDVELFDLGMVGHTPPRLFVDIVAFVEMADDRRSFRLMQETRSGRVTLGETSDEKQMTALVTDYIAERLVERERALAAQGMHLKPPALPKAAAPVAAAATAERSGQAPTQDMQTQDMPTQEPQIQEQQASTPAQPAPSPPAFLTPAAAAQPAPRAPQTLASASGAALRREPAGGGWLWPLLALLIGIGLGALALYLYAASLARP